MKKCEQVGCASKSEANGNKNTVEMADNKKGNETMDKKELVKKSALNKEREEAADNAIACLEEYMVYHADEKYMEIENDMDLYCGPMGELPSEKYEAIRDQVFNGGKRLPANMTCPAKLLVRYMRRKEADALIDDAVNEMAQETFMKMLTEYKKKGVPKHTAPVTANECCYDIPQEWEKMLDILPEELNAAIVRDLETNSHEDDDIESADDFYVLHLLMMLTGDRQDGYDFEGQLTKAYNVFVAANGDKPVYNN